MARKRGIDEVELFADVDKPLDTVNVHGSLVSVSPVKKDGLLTILMARLQMATHHCVLLDFDPTNKKNLPHCLTLGSQPTWPTAR